MSSRAASRVDTNSVVLAECRAAGIIPVVIPAKLTGLLQPLDTHAFAAYKHRVRKAFMEARVRAADGNVSVAAFLGCVQQAIRSVLQGRLWAEAFDSNGFCTGQARVSQRVMAELDFAAPLAVPSTPPSLEQLQRLLLAGSRVPAAFVGMAQLLLLLAQ